MLDGTCYNDQVRTNINGHLSDKARFRAGLQNWFEISKMKENITFRLADRQTDIPFSLCVQLV